MKYIITTISFFISTAVFAQKDFDYTVYTNHAVYTSENIKDTLKLTLFRKIQKEANIIKVISTGNTGDAETYVIKYVGYDLETNSLVYILADKKTIYINPMEPTIKIVDEERKTKVVYY